MPATPVLPPLLPESFYARDALVVARDLLGKELRSGDVRLRITEVEAYRHPGDTASHCRMGRTPRNAVMWGPPGRAYVYLCYGIHSLLNLVTDREDEGAAVLIRACEPIAGIETILARRHRDEVAPALLTGPGKVTIALGIDTRSTGLCVFEPGDLEVRDGPAIAKILAGPRVGIDYALPEHRRAPWRLAIADTKWVSQPKGLKPVRTRPTRS